MRKRIGKRLLAFVCATALTISSLSVAPLIQADAVVLDGLSELGRQVSTEGGVLVKNGNQVLLFQSGTKVSVFGRMQDDYYSCGTGSGGEVKEKYTISILEGLQKSNLEINEDLLNTYRD